ncbi:MAG: M13 family metallopeptidase N-terminal domain-containing protein, partial [Myxococcota bacterium]
MKTRPLAFSLLFALSCASQSKTPEAGPEAKLELSESKPELGTFGIDLSARKSSVKPGDDFYAYANGTWLDTYKLKPDEQRFGAFIKLAYRSEDRVKAIIDELGAMQAKPGSLEQKVGDYFSSYMDVETLNARGLAPLQPELDEIAAISSTDMLIQAFGRAGLIETKSPIAGYIGFDRKNPDR